MPWVQRISGAILILVGLLLVSGEFTRLAAWLNSLTPDWLLQRV
jgi:cytochrome c-type biogenesis protein